MGNVPVFTLKNLKNRIREKVLVQQLFRVSSLSEYREEGIFVGNLEPILPLFVLADNLQNVKGPMLLMD
jgi:hypothetical protein